MWVIYCAYIYQRTFRNIHLLRKCMAANTPQGVGADSSRPFFNPNQMVLMCRNDMNCNANDGNTQPIWWVFVGTGTINRPLRLRGGCGKTWVNVAINNKMSNAKYINEHIMCGLFIAHIYINEHSAISIYCANVWQRTHRKA